MEYLSSLLIGILYAAAPGPIFVETVRQGIKDGLPGSLAVQGGSCLGLIIYAFLAFSGAGLLLQARPWQLVAGLAGMAALIYLGLNTILNARTLVVPSTIEGQGASSIKQAFLSGAFFSLANPLDIVFWLSIGSRALQDPNLSSTHYLGGLFLGILLAALGTALFAGFWHRRLTGKTAKGLSWCCGMALIGFGLRLGYSAGLELFS